MRILGVDPGYAIVGFGVLEYTGTIFTPITYGAITTAAETPFLRRLESIYRDFRTLIQHIPSGLCGDGTTLFHIQPKNAN